MDNSLIAYALFFVGLIVIQHFNRKAILKLSVEEKAKLMEYSSGVAVWRLIPTVVIIIGFMGFMYLKPSISHMKLGLTIYLVLILLSSIVSSVVIQRKYRVLGFPEPYLKTTLMTSVATTLLIIGLFIWIMVPFSRIH